MKKKILIVTKNIFSRSGGGETVYRSIIKNNPNYNFYYLADNIKSESPPKNAFPYAYRNKNLFYRSNIFNITNCSGEALSLFKPFQGMSFDVIDIPDFMPLGMPLLRALSFYKINRKMLVVALHGALSKYNHLSWISKGDEKYFDAKSKKMFSNEISQLNFSDYIYGFSEAYVNTFPYKYKSILIDPINLLFKSQNNEKFDRHALYQHSKNENISYSKKIKLVFIGRLDRQKGPDFLFDIALSLSASIKFELIFFTSYDESTKDGIACLNNLSKSRNISYKIYYGLETKKIFALLQNQKAVILIPSRQDSLNIVCLEAIYFGIPFLLRDTCGASHYLEKLFDNNFINFSVSTVNQYAEKIENFYAHYDKAKLSMQTLRKLFYKRIKRKININPYDDSKIPHNSYLFDVNNFIRNLVNKFLFLFKPDINFPFLKKIQRNFFRSIAFFNIFYFIKSKRINILIDTQKDLDVNLIFIIDNIDVNVDNFIERLSRVLRETKCKVAPVLIISNPIDNNYLKKVINMIDHLSVIQADGFFYQIDMIKGIINNLRGQYITLFDSNFLAFNGCIDQLYKTLKCNPELTGVFFNSIQSKFNSSGWFIEDLNDDFCKYFPYLLKRKEFEDNLEQNRLPNISGHNFFQHKKDKFLFKNESIGQYCIFSD